jgi:hypothetical protein
MQQQADSFVVQSEQVGLVPMGKHRRGVLRLTKQRLNRGVFHSMSRLLKEHNMQPKPFVWIADPIKLSPPCAERIKC